MIDVAGKAEKPFSVVMPGARLRQQSHLGERWRAREFTGQEHDHSGALLLDTRANVIVASRCACEEHALSTRSQLS